MEIYDHIDYARRIATALRDIDHSSHRPRFFVAHGIEELYEFDEKLSSISGMVLIAVDGFESESVYNHADNIMERRHYGYIIARNVITDKPGDITKAMEECWQVCKQIRNLLLHDPNLQGYLDRSTTMNGVGPIGDNFWGCMLSIEVDHPDTQAVDWSYFKS